MSPPVAGRRLLAGLLLSAPGASAAATLRGQVVTAEDGAPVAPAEVQLINGSLGGVALETDAEGRWAATDLPPGRYRVRAIPRWSLDRPVRYAPDAADFCAAEVFDLAEDDVVENIFVQVPTGGSLSVRLRDPAGAPLVGATVWVQAPEDTRGLYDRPAITDADGRATVVGVDPAAPFAEWVVRVTADALPNQWIGGGYEDAEATRFPKPGPAGVDAGEHKVLAGISVQGQVFGPDGPVNEGTAHVYSRSQVRSVPIDSDGRYRATGLPTGEVIAWVNVPGLAMTYYPDADRPGERIPAEEEGVALRGVDLQSPAEAVFWARFLDAEQGSPIPNVGGLLYNDTQTVGLGDQGKEDGTLRIDRLHGGDWKLYAWAKDEGYTDDWIRDDNSEERIFTIEAGEEGPLIELRLPLASGGTGEVHDERGRPAAVTITLTREDGLTTGATADTEGRWTVDGLLPGRWRLAAEPTALCPGDPATVPVYWPGTVNPDWQGWLEIGPGEQSPHIALIAPVDADLDQMGDGWEAAHGLDPATDDSALDPDGDQYTNLDEYRLNTDPHSAAAIDSGCGCAHGSAGAGLAPIAVGLAALARRRRRA